MVRSVKNVEVTSPTGGISVKLVCFTIDRLWKGNREAVQRVYTGLGGPDCGFPFEAGRRYVVTAEPGESFYGGLGPKTLFASRCSLTTAADRGAELTKRLDRELGGSTQQRD
jgi:hypothetical protein